MLHVIQTKGITRIANKPCLSQDASCFIQVFSHFSHRHCTVSTKGYMYHCSDTQMTHNASVRIQWCKCWVLQRCISKSQWSWRLISLCGEVKTWSLLHIDNTTAKCLVIVETGLEPYAIYMYTPLGCTLMCPTKGVMVKIVIWMLTLFIHWWPYAPPAWKFLVSTEWFLNPRFACHASILVSYVHFLSSKQTSCSSRSCLHITCPSLSSCNTLQLIADNDLNWWF